MSSKTIEAEDLKIWKQCISLQNTMKKALKSNNNPFTKEIEELRAKFCCCTHKKNMYVIDKYVYI